MFRYVPFTVVSSTAINVANYVVLDILKAAVSMNLNKILGRSKRDKKVKKKFWNTTWQLNAPERAPLGNCLVYVYQFSPSNSNFKTTSNFQNFQFPEISLNLWEKLFFPKYDQKSPKDWQKSPKRRYVWWAERFLIAWNVNEIFALKPYYSTKIRSSVYPILKALYIYHSPFTIMW